MDLVARVRVLPVKGESDGAATAFLTVSTIPFVGEKVLQGREEKGAEPAFLAAELLKVVLFEKTGKEGLGEVLGIFLGRSLPADVHIQGIPIGAAELLQGDVGLGSSAATGGEHNGPARGGEDIAAHGSWFGHI